VSVVRWSYKSNVYVYHDVNGFIACCGCWIRRRNFYARTERGMIAHLRRHVELGHKVPAYAFKELERCAKYEPNKAPPTPNKERS
jgi:hypothetical protein